MRWGGGGWRCCQESKGEQIVIMSVSSNLQVHNFYSSVVVGTSRVGCFLAVGGGSVFVHCSYSCAVSNRM
jgi:hypothetical protein